MKHNQPWLPAEIPARLRKDLERFTPGTKGWFRRYKGKVRYVCSKTTPLDQVENRWIKVKLAIDAESTARVDAERRAWTSAWLTERGLPDVSTGSYYVRSFRVRGAVAAHLRPLVRDGVLRCCLKPTPT